MPPIGVDEWMDNFVAEWAPDHDPSNLPSASEQKAVSEYLHGKISVEEAAFAYTRDTISGQTSGDVWFLIYHIAQDLPEAQGRLIELIRAISTLPDESCASGKDQSWSTVSLGDLHGDLCDYWDGTTANARTSFLIDGLTEDINRPIRLYPGSSCDNAPSSLRRPDQIHRSSWFGRSPKNSLFLRRSHVLGSRKRGIIAGAGYLAARRHSLSRMGGTRRICREPEGVRHPWPSPEKGKGAWGHQPLAILEVPYGSAWG